MSEKEAPKITKVYSFANGMCIVFDQYGKQMPDFQGRTNECVPKIRAAGFTGEIPYGTLRRA
jgi:hypothetical protein